MEMRLNTWLSPLDLAVTSYTFVPSKPIEPRADGGDTFTLTTEGVHVLHADGTLEKFTGEWVQVEQAAPRGIAQPIITVPSERCVIGDPVGVTLTETTFGDGGTQV